MRRGLFALAVLAVLLCGAVYAWCTRFGSTPPFRDAQGHIAAGSIAEYRPLKIGGVTQWVLIRGRDARAPILIWLSGGPGSDETFLLRHFDSALEDHFLVVYWTQRGTGRSYNSSLSKAGMNITRFVADLDELVDYVTTRFHRSKVDLAGHSWGTAIGSKYMAAHPDKVAAYAGIGQLTNEVESDRLGAEFALREARARRDAEAIAALSRLGPPPYSMAALQQQRACVSKFGGAFYRPVPFYRLVWDSYSAPEATWFDLRQFSPGETFSLETLWPQIARFDIANRGMHFAMPVAIFAGRHDYQVSAKLAHDYYEKLDAPLKRFVWFEDSAHSPNFEEPAKFTRELTAFLDAANARRTGL